jgi:hypothetical protein
MIGKWVFLRASVRTVVGCSSLVPTSLDKDEALAIFGLFHCDDGDGIRLNGTDV